MANANAISAVCEAVASILRAAVTPAQLGLSTPENPENLNFAFAVYHSNDFADLAPPIKVDSGASIFLYRVVPNLSCRNPPGKLWPDGSRSGSGLSLDLHLLITIWAQTSDIQNRLVGWVMHVLEQHPILCASELNSAPPRDSFWENETVDLVLGEINNEELLQLWETLGHGEMPYQISIPYLARSVVIDSSWVLTEEPPVQSRTLDMQCVGGG